MLLALLIRPTIYKNPLSKNSKYACQDYVRKFAKLELFRFGRVLLEERERERKREREREIQIIFN
jgi:hypothetical protein